MEFLRSSKRIILLITVTVIITLIVSSTISIWLSKVINMNIPSLGTIKTLGVEAYWDLNLENKTEAIDWGTIWLGTSKNVTLYIRSLSSIETTFELKTANWTFRDSTGGIVAGPNESSPFMNLTWNYNKTIVRPGETVKVILVLSIDSSFEFVKFLIANDVKEFSFDILIRTSEYSD